MYTDVHVHNTNLCQRLEQTHQTNKTTNKTLRHFAAFSETETWPFSSHRRLTFYTHTHTHTHTHSTHTHTHTHTNTTARTHARTHTNEQSDNTKLKTGSKQRWRETAAQNRKHGRSTVLGKEIFLGYIWMSPDRASVGEEGVHFCRAFPTALGNLQ